MLEPYMHHAAYNIQSFSFEVSDDGVSFTEARSGSNDYSGSLFIYAFDPPLTTRYIRFNMKENFPGEWAPTDDRFVFSNLWAGKLAAP